MILLQGKKPGALLVFGCRGMNSCLHRPGIALRALCVASLFAAAPVRAQALSDADLQKRANAILTLMGFSLTPDVTTGALSISDQTAGDPYFRQTSISGGGRPSKNLPMLYLEGTLA